MSRYPSYSVERMDQQFAEAERNDRLRRKRLGKRICQTCEGVGRVVGEDGIGFRPSKSDLEEADECPDCKGIGYTVRA